MKAGEDGSCSDAAMRPEFASGPPTQLEAVCFLLFLTTHSNDLVSSRAMSNRNHPESLVYLRLDRTSSKLKRFGRCLSRCGNVVHFYVYPDTFSARIRYQLLRHYGHSVDPRPLCPRPLVCILIEIMDLGSKTEEAHASGANRDSNLRERLADAEGAGVVKIH